MSLCACWCPLLLISCLSVTWKGCPPGGLLVRSWLSLSRTAWLSLTCFIPPAAYRVDCAALPIRPKFGCASVRPSSFGEDDSGIAICIFFLSYSSSWYFLSSMILALLLKKPFLNSCSLWKSIGVCSAKSIFSLYSSKYWSLRSTSSW